MSIKFLENPTNKKRVVTLGAALCVLAVGWQLYGVLTAEPQITKPLPLVRTLTTTASTTDPSELYPGEVRGRYESNLGFQVPGKIISRQVQLGDRVSSGQVLLTLDPQDIQQAVNASIAQVSAAQSQYDLAVANVRRFEQLQASGAVSQATLDQYRTQLEAASSALEQAQAQAISNNNKLDYTQLCSDAAGVVANLNGEVGQVVSAGMPLVTVVQDGQREIQIFVPENKLQQVQLGQKAQVSFWALEGVEATGTVSEIAPMADPLTKTYRVRVALDQLPPQVRLGMTAKVSLGQQKGKQLLLPTSALYQTNDQPQVWVVREGRVHLTPVTLGAHQENQVAIESGLEPGQVVVTAGVNKLLENQEVRVIESGETNEKS